MDIFRRRLKPIQESQVDTVVTSCMGCLLQFLDGLHQEGQGVEAKHLAEVLSKTITVPKN
jgi:Fe-S oxidoreductase